MNRSLLFPATLAAAALAGCGSGDINIEPTTSVEGGTAPNPPAGGNNDLCASYVNAAGQTIQGTAEGDNCVYSPSFVDAGNNLMVDMTIPALPNGGAHIFEGSLFVGETWRDDAEMAAAGIAEGGDGPVLTVEAGATLAFQSSQFHGHQPWLTDLRRRHARRADRLHVRVRRQRHGRTGGRAAVGRRRHQRLRRYEFVQLYRNSRRRRSGDDSRRPDRGSPWRRRSAIRFTEDHDVSTTDIPNQVIIAAQTTKDPDTGEALDSGR